MSWLSHPSTTAKYTVTTLQDAEEEDIFRVEIYPKIEWRLGDKKKQKLRGMIILKGKHKNLM